MKIVRSIRQMSRISRGLRLRCKSIGFIPTMGALHLGHISLIRQARRDNDIVVVSIFVNPAQFSPKEDFKKYPRDLKRDAGLCKKEGVDIIFNPEVNAMYPDGYKTYVNVNDLSNLLCGYFRPGHFNGVATVVTKLFNIVTPDAAYFGQKDAQQAIIIKRMTEDLNIPVKIKVMPTVREKDGLALSSRNTYLNEKERQDALVLYGALNKAKDSIRQGNRATATIIRNMNAVINKKSNTKIDYVSIVNLEDLKPVGKIRDKVLVALAVWVGKTRLIDNIVVNP